MCDFHAEFIALHERSRDDTWTNISYDVLHVDITVLPDVITATAGTTSTACSTATTGTTACTAATGSASGAAAGSTTAAWITAGARLMNFMLDFILSMCRMYE